MAPLLTPRLPPPSAVSKIKQPPSQPISSQPCPPCPCPPQSHEDSELTAAASVRDCQAVIRRLQAENQRQAAEVASLLVCGFCSKDYHWQVASAEHDSSGGYRYPEVRPRSEAADTFWAQLAWCTWAHQVSAQYVFASLSGWNCYTVSSGTLHPSLCDCLKTSSFYCQSSVCCAVLPLEFIQMSGFLCRWPDDMELTTETSICAILFTPYLFLDDYLRHFFFRVQMYAAH